MLHLWQKALQLVPIIRQEHKVVCIAHVVFYAKDVFDILVKNVHVHVGEELGGEVAKWQAHSRIGGEAAQDNPNQSHDALVANADVQCVKQNALIHRGEEFANIAFQHPHRAMMVLGDPARHVSEPIERLVDALANPTRKRVGNEGGVETGRKDAIKRAMHHSIAHRRLVDLACLGIVDGKRNIGRMPICLRPKAFMQLEEIVHQISCKRLHIRPRPFTLHKLLPGLQQVLYRNNLIVAMVKQDSGHNHVGSPPPHEVIAYSGKVENGLQTLV